MISDIIAAFASIAVALYYSWKLTLVILATVPLSAVLLYFASRRLEPAIQGQRAFMAVASKHITASLLGIDLVKVFGGYETEVRQYNKAIRNSSGPFNTVIAISAFQMGFVNFWITLMFVVGFWYGVALVDDGLEPGQVITTFYTTMAAFQGVEALLPHWLVLARGMSAGGFLSAVVSHVKRGNKKVWKMGRTLRPAAIFGDIKLIDVSTVVLQASSSC